MTTLAEIPASYLKLIRKLPLITIRREADYDAAVEMAQALAAKGEDKLDRGESEYLDALSSLIEAYESKHHDLSSEKMPVHKKLAWLAKESALSQQQLAKLLGCSPALVSLILAGKRSLTVAHIRALSDHFHVNPRYFMD